MNYTSTTVLKQRQELERQREEETIIGQVLALCFAGGIICIGFWLAG